MFFFLYSQNKHLLKILENRGGSRYGPNRHRPPFCQLNHANSAYSRLFLGYFGVILATRPPPFWISAPLFTDPGFAPGESRIEIYTCFFTSTHEAKKENTLSQSLREFFKPTRHAFFYFLFNYFFYFNWPLPPRTSETKND